MEQKFTILCISILIKPMAKNVYSVCIILSMDLTKITENVLLHAPFTISTTTRVSK